MFEYSSRRTFMSKAAALAGAAALAARGQVSSRRTRNIIFIMTDGLRWQDVFFGADDALLNKENGGVSDVDALRRDYWRNTVKAKREALMPFLWTEIARNGQIYGNRKAGSEVSVTNGMNFSYPGYSETLCGFADPRIDSNDKRPNPNVTVLEWLQAKPAYRGKVAAFGAWDDFPFILNVERSQLLVNAGFDPLTAPPVTPTLDLLNRMKGETRIWDEEPLDMFTFHTALEYLQLHTPRILFLSLGETDEWAHGGNYAAYLDSAHRVDLYLGKLWNAVQAIPQYRGTTTLIFSSDHGRGEAPVEWRNHGQKVPDSKYIWMAFLGPDTPARGEVRDTTALTQSQIAATLAALLGEDYPAAVPKAGAAIKAVLGD